MPNAESRTYHLSSAARSGAATALVLASAEPGLPHVVWIGPLGTGVPAAELADDLAATISAIAGPTSSHSATSRALSLLPQASEGWLGRPGLVGYRLGDGTQVGRDWSSAFTSRSIEVSSTAIVVHAVDEAAGLALRTDIEAVGGGALRMRHKVSNTRAQPYLVESLDISVPVSERVTDTLDMTGRWALERSPQRRRIGDGTWLREGRGGRPGFDSPTVLIAGTAGFGFGHGLAWGIHLAWSGTARHFLHRQPSGAVSMGAGELLAAGEVVLEQGGSYTTPWLHIGASATGLDELAAQNHDFLRSLATHPRRPVPVVSNVWEAVYFDHDLTRLRHLADLAAEIGVERFVLDDGWFGSRRDDTSGLGDWVVSEQAWPQGLTPLIDHVLGLGMQFGLWFEPEMVNPDSELYRTHPDWILNVPGHRAHLLRNQLVLDLSRAEVRNHLFEQMHAVLSDNAVSYVKWDHNRELIDAGSAAREGAVVVHAQTLGFYDLLDRLRAAHPDVEWESCASGGGRIDLGVLARTQRVWTSDMTDALARLAIQRWTGQLVAPEYLGAHVSAPVNHQTGRHFSLDFRAGTALFASFGIEWDISDASRHERARLAEWVSVYKKYRDLLHSGRMVRVDTEHDDVWIYGVVAADRSQALFSYVQLDEIVHDPPAMRCPGLDPRRRYTARQVLAPVESTVETHWPSGRRSGWRGEPMTLSGEVLGSVGLPGAPRRPLSALVVHLQAG